MKAVAKHPQPLSLFEDAKQAFINQQAVVADIAGRLEHAKGGFDSLAEIKTHVESLKKQRTRALATAKIDGAEPDTKHIDAELEALEKRLASGEEPITGEIALILGERLADAQTELERLRAAAQDAAFVEVSQEYAAAVDDYLKASEALRLALGRMQAAQIAAHKLNPERTRLELHPAYGQILPGLSLVETVRPYNVPQWLLRAKGQGVAFGGVGLILPDAGMAEKYRLDAA